jgi:hypothetical protein
MTEIVKARVKRVVDETFATVERSLSEAIAAASAEPARGGLTCRPHADALTGNDAEHPLKAARPLARTANVAATASGAHLSIGDWPGTFDLGGEP